VHTDYSQRYQQADWNRAGVVQEVQQQVKPKNDWTNQGVVKSVNQKPTLEERIRQIDIEQ